MRRAVHRTITVILAGLPALAGCSFYDFLGYRNDAPLHIVDRPSGYPSARFGTEIAPTTSRGERIVDLVGVSAGEGYATVFYELAVDGRLVDVDDPLTTYDRSNQAADERRAGAALAGLPLWGDEFVTGCVAIGETGPPLQVAIHCPVHGVTEEITAAAVLAQDPVVDEILARRFGHRLAAVRPMEGQAWLLAAASEYFAVVCSAVGRCTDRLVPVHDGRLYPGSVVELAAGRMADGRIYVALTTADSSGGAVVNRLHLFTQDALASLEFTQAACLDRPGQTGFAGVMVTGDLDRDGTDELLLSAGPGEGRSPVVHVYDPAALEAAGPRCDDDAPAPFATIEPGDGPLDVKCGDGCDFGAVIAVGDIATDDDGPEVIIGAPGAAVDGVSRAGAVYIYRGVELKANGRADVAGRVAHSSPVRGAHFGGGLAVAPVAGRNELLVGMTGRGKLVIAYCTGVGEDLEAGADVTTNLDGTVVSTRCRPK